MSHPTAAGRLLGWILDRRGIGRPVARALRAPLGVRAISSRITRFHALLLRRGRGRLRRSWLFAAGQPVMSLTTTGRRTGIERSTAVSGFTDGDDLVLAAMNLGRTTQPGWVHNLRSDPRAVIDLGGRRIQVITRESTGAEAARLWLRWVELQPSALRFREIAEREIPTFTVRAAP